MKPHPLRPLLAAALALAVLLPVGCASKPRRPTPTVSTGMDPGERTRKAQQLADQGDKARGLGNTDRAIELYRESIEYSADYADVWNNLGLLQLEKGEYDKAISSFTMAGELDPTDPRPPTNIGITNLRAGWAEYALQDFHRALEITPSYLPALRGAIRSADLLGRAEFEDLERVRRALLAERDEQWRAYFERQRFLIESRVKADRPPARTSAAGTTP
jgi:tetratricopeptide (TPR) repeat protein